MEKATPTRKLDWLWWWTVPYTVAIFLIVTVVRRTGIQRGQTTELLWVGISLAFLTSPLAGVWLLFNLRQVLRSSAEAIETQTKIMVLLGIAAVLWWPFL